MANFNASEILQFAVEIETNGERYYRHFAQTLAEEQAKELFSFLAEEEVQHRQTFQRMLGATETFQPRESYPEEYFAYLRAYVDNAVFNRDALAEKVQQVTSQLSAIEFGMNREMESVYYYTELMRFASSEHQPTIEEIISEERRHFAKLFALKKVIMS